MFTTTAAAAATTASDFYFDLVLKASLFSI
jgi:hypothetical protein